MDEHIKEIKPGKHYEHVMSQINLWRWGVGKLLKRQWNKEDAQDIATKALIMTARKYDEKRGNLGSVYFFSLLHESGRFIRAKNKRKDINVKVLDKELNSNIENLLVEDGSDFAKNFEMKDDCENLMKYLSERERKLVQMYFWEDKTYRAIGKEIGISYERVRQIINQGIKKIRQGIGIEELVFLGFDLDN